MNIADSLLVRAILERAGYSRTERPEEADVILLNTCAIREHAEQRVLGRLSSLAMLKGGDREVTLGLLGCMAQHERTRLVEQAPHLDLIAGPDSYRRLPELLADARLNPTADVRLDRTETYSDFRPEHEGGVRGFVTVMRGCDRFCTFCVVPYVRGRERSVPPDAIVAQVQGLAERGVKEIVLLGQTVNAYRHDSTDFARLLRLVAAVDGIERIRFTSPHPSDMSEAVIEAIAGEPKVQPYLHLPVQSGSDRILARMERGYTVARYLELVAGLRGAVAQLALSTDIIVGFHGEEESDFEATLALMRQVQYDSAFTFKYSRREKTRAYGLGDTVGEDEKARRLAEVIALQEGISLVRNRELIGVRLPVLVEGPARRGAGMMAGKTPQFKTAVFEAFDGVKPGDTVMVQVDSVTAHTLNCAPVANAPQGLSAADVRRS